MFGKSLLKSYSNALNLFSRFSDPVLIVFAAYFSVWLKFDFDFPNVSKDYKLLILFVFFAAISVFPLFDLYASWRGQSLLKQAKAIFLVRLLGGFRFNVSIIVQDADIWFFALPERKGA